MNKARLIKNRLTINWNGISKLNILDIEKINRKRYWIRLNKKKDTVYINGLLKFYKNEEND
jgi:hypothetical protein